jgi:hypothetical protein
MSDVVFHPIQAPVGGAEDIPAPLGAAPTNQVVFGITFNLNGTLVPISSDDLANIKANGIELTLPGPTIIGTIADFVAWFNAQFPNVQLPPASDFPPPLNTIFDKIASLVWTVNAAHVKVPPSGSQDSILYTLTVSAAWTGAGIPLIPGVLSIQGGVFGVTNEGTS